MPVRRTKPLIVVTSDLHIGHDRRGALPTLAAEIAEARPDVFVIAGDLGHSPRDFERTLKIFQGVPGIKGVLPGNHCLWLGSGIEHFGLTSRALFNVTLPDLAESYGWIWLEETDIQRGAVAVVGTIGWYDYSVVLQRDPTASVQEIRKNKRLFNNDGNYMDQDWDDLAFARECESNLKTRLERLESDPTVKDIHVITHVPVFAEQKVAREEDNRDADAYFYNYSLGRTIAGFSKVTRVISGHTHRPVRTLIQRDGMFPIEARVIGSDYGVPIAEYLPARPRGLKRRKPLADSVEVHYCGDMPYIRASEIPEPLRSAFLYNQRGSGQPGIKGVPDGDAFFAWDWFGYIGQPIPARDRGRE